MKVGPSEQGRTWLRPSSMLVPRSLWCRIGITSKTFWFPRSSLRKQSRRGVISDEMSNLFDTLNLS